MFGLFSKKSKTPVNREFFSHADYNIIFDHHTIEGKPIDVLEIGTLKVPTGQLIVLDPLACPEDNLIVLDKSVHPGEYPVRIYIARNTDMGDRYALAKLEFSKTRAEKWMLALTKGNDTRLLKEKGDFFGYIAETGLGSFVDYRCGLDYLRFRRNFFLNNPKSNIYDDFFASEFKKNAENADDPNDVGNWVNFPIPQSNSNIVMFQSGYGDGHYPSYWGISAENEIVSLVIDFHVLLLPDE